MSLFCLAECAATSSLVACPELFKVYAWRKNKDCWFCVCTNSKSDCGCTFYSINTRAEPIDCTCEICSNADTNDEGKSHLRLPSFQTVKGINPKCSIYTLQGLYTAGLVLPLLILNKYFMSVFWSELARLKIPFPWPVWTRARQTEMQSTCVLNNVF